MFVDKFIGKTALREHLLKNAAALPSACQIILDDLAIDDHTGYDVTEAPVKLPGLAQDLFALLFGKLMFT